MRIVYHQAKNDRNVQERGLSFDRAADFDLASAMVTDRYHHGEWRKIAVGYLEDRLHVLCFTQIENGCRVISFRRANAREAARYGMELRKVRG